MVAGSWDFLMSFFGDPSQMVDVGALTRRRWWMCLP
jgi:hypothetical protein